jgi:methylmalonyl-CoA/ethylmalonyl-CoA epimerase
VVGDHGDLAAALGAAKEGRGLLLGGHEVAKDGADNKRIAFLHPKSTGSLLVEICQEKSA